VGDDIDGREYICKAECKVEAPLVGMKLLDAFAIVDGGATVTKSNELYKMKNTVLV